MQKETEIKLRVSRETLAALREHPLLKKRNKSGWERRELMNQYFDTPERDLAQAKVALRLRKDGDDIIQTLKTPRPKRRRLVGTQRIQLGPAQSQARREETRWRVLARATGRAGQKDPQADLHHRLRA